LVRFEVIGVMVAAVAGAVAVVVVGVWVGIERGTVEAAAALALAGAVFVVQAWIVSRATVDWALWQLAHRDGEPGRGRGPAPAPELDRRGRQRPGHGRGAGRGARAEPAVGDGHHVQGHKERQRIAPRAATVPSA
jgi:hypothetical protein